MVLSGSERGGASIKAIIILAVLASVIHISIKLVPVYLDAESMKDEMAMKARFAQMHKDEEILVDLEKKAASLRLPLDKEDFQLMRDDGNRRMKIHTTWDVEVKFFFDIYPPLTRRVLHFNPIIEEDYARQF